MAGDIVAFFGLNDKDFQKGLTRAAAAAGSLSAKVKMASGDIQKSFGKAAVGVQNIGMASFAAVGTAATLAVKSVMDYSEVNSQVKGDLEAIGQIGGTIWRDIGRDISGATGAVREWVGSIVSGARKARDAMANWAAETMRWWGLGSDENGTVGEVTDAQKAQELQDATFKVRRMIRKVEGDIAAMGGDDLQAKLIAIDEAREKAMAKINEDFGMVGPLSAAQTEDKNNLIAKTNDYFNLRKAAAEDERLMQNAAELDRQDAERRKAIDEQARISDAELERERAQSNAQILLGFETRRLEVDTLRQNGEQREADLLEARLDAYQRIYEINHQTMIDEQDKASAIDAINRNLAARESTIMQGDQAVRGVTGSLGVGFGGIRGLASQVFGGEAGDSAKKQVKLQERMVRVLESIERKTGAGLAVFAP